MQFIVSNLPQSVSEKDLWELFSTFGDVVNINLAKHRHTGESRGFAFIEMFSRSGCRQAIEALDNKDFRSRNLFCERLKQAWPAAYICPGKEKF
jgi:RNA recognition motif-containing protein